MTDAPHDRKASPTNPGRQFWRGGMNSAQSRDSSRSPDGVRAGLNTIAVDCEALERLVIDALNVVRFASIVGDGRFVSAVSFEDLKASSDKWKARLGIDFTDEAPSDPMVDGVESMLVDWRDMGRRPPARDLAERIVEGIRTTDSEDLGALVYAAAFVVQGYRDGHDMAEGIGPLRRAIEPFADRFDLTGKPDVTPPWAAACMGSAGPWATKADPCVPSTMGAAASLNLRLFGHHVVDECGSPPAARKR